MIKLLGPPSKGNTPGSALRTKLQEYFLRTGNGGAACIQYGNAQTVF